jgi:cell wall-associated NlpC family hydrolase
MTVQRLVGLPYKKTSGDQFGVDCFGLIKRYWQAENIRPYQVYLYLFTEDFGVGHQNLITQVKLMVVSFKIEVTDIFYYSVAIQKGDILLFAVRDKAIDHLGIAQDGNHFYQVSKQSGTILTLLTANWENKLKGIIRCLME